MKTISTTKRLAAMQALIEEQKASIEELAEDSALLDFLLARSVRFPCQNGNGEWLVSEYIGEVIGRGKTPREALRAALAATRPSPLPSGA